MKRFFPFLVIILAVTMLLGCATTKGESPPLTEDILLEPGMDEGDMFVEETPSLEIEATEPLVEESLLPAEDLPFEPEEEAPAVAAIPEPTPLPGGRALHEVFIPQSQLKLMPSKVTIRLGDTVKWENKDNRQKHFLASVPGSGTTDKLEIFSLMPPGSVYEHTFEVAGEYPYFCFIHNQMRGHITVVQ